MLNISYSKSNKCHISQNHSLPRFNTWETSKIKHCIFILFFRSRIYAINRYPVCIQKKVILSDLGNNRYWKQCTNYTIFEHPLQEVGWNKAKMSGKSICPLQNPLLDFSVPKLVTLALGSDHSFSIAKASKETPYGAGKLERKIKVSIATTSSYSAQILCCNLAAGMLWGRKMRKKFVIMGMCVCLEVCFLSEKWEWLQHPKQLPILHEAIEKTWTTRSDQTACMVMYQSFKMLLVPSAIIWL